MSTATDPHRLISTTEVAALMGWSRWRAREWLKRHGLAVQNGRKVVVPLGRLLDAFPDAAASTKNLRDRMHLADDFKRMESRLRTAEDRVRALERAVREIRKQGRAQAQRLRRLRNLQTTETTESPARDEARSDEQFG